MKYRNLIKGIHEYRLVIVLLLLMLYAACDIYAQQFGKNKVQYQNFEWKFIKTKHFDVYFAEDGEYLARYAGIHAERALLSIEDRLRYSITKRISLIVYNSHNEFQQTNIVGEFMPEGVGGVTELFKNRITVPFEGRYNQFRHVIHHELVHAVLNDMFYGGSVQSMIANNIRVELPLWMNEGLAEFEGNGGYDTYTDMFMRDIALSELLKGLDKLTGYSAYRGGQAFYWYISEKYGERKIGELLGRLRATGNVESAFTSTFGKTPEVFSEEWVLEMKKKYLPDLEKFEGLDEFAIRVTNHKKDHSFYNSSPALSPSGDKLAFISNRENIFGVYLLDINNREKGPEELINSGREIDFEELNILTPGISWSPDGKFLAVSAKAGGEDALYIVNASNGDYEKHVFGIKTVTSAMWSPDGLTIAFVGSVGEQADIWLYDVKTGSIIRLTDDVFTDSNPVWSADGKKIYFISDRADFVQGEYKAEQFGMWKHDVEQSDIYEIDIERGLIGRLTFSPNAHKTSLAATGNNESIVYVSDINGIGNVYELQLEDGKTIARTNSLHGITQLSLASDGSKLFFTSQHDGGYDIYEMRYPLERKAYDSLPLTKFIASKQDKQQSNKEEEILNPLVSEKQDLKGYGNSVDIEFSRQQLIHPNADISIEQIERDVQSPFAAIALAQQDNDIANPQITPVQDYKIAFSNDVILANAGYNTFWGYQGITQMLFSDMLGDHQIYFQANLFLDLRNSNFLVAYTYLPKIIDWQVMVNHNVGFGYTSSSTVQSPYSYLYRFRNYGFGGSGSYPFSRYRRLEFGLNYMNLSKENIEVPQESMITRNMIVGETKMVFDNTLPGWYGPSAGTRYTFGIQAAPQLTTSAMGFALLTADFRQYFTLTENFLFLAFRGAGGMGFSTNPEQQFFFIGGTDNWINRSFANGRLPFVNPEDFAFMNYSLPMRGWDVNERNGTKYFLINTELRFPLFTALLAGPVPVVIQGFQGALFMDIGSAWTNSLSTNYAEYGDTYKYKNPNAGDLLMSAGIGIRSFLLGLPIRLDIAWRKEYYAWSQPLWMVSLGGDF